MNDSSSDKFGILHSLESVAHHEAGHFVVGALLGLRALEVYIEPSSTGAFGRCIWNDEVRLYSSSFALMIAGGPASTAHTHYSKDDLLSWISFYQSICKRRWDGRLKPDWVTYQAHRGRDAPHAIQEDFIGLRDPKDYGGYCCLLDRQALTTNLVLLSYDIVASNWGLVQQVAQALLAAPEWNADGRRMLRGHELHPIVFAGLGVLPVLPKNRRDPKFFNEDWAE